MSYAAGVGAGGGIAILGVIAGALLSKRQTNAQMEEFLGDVNALKPAMVENFDRLEAGLEEAFEQAAQAQKAVKEAEAAVAELAQTAITRENLDQVARQIAEGEAARAAAMQRPAPVFTPPAPPVPPAQQQWREAQIDEAVNARLQALQEQMRQAESAFSGSR